MAIERWEIDSGHSGILLTARHMMVARVRGWFSRWSGTILADTGDLRRSTVDVYIDASSLQTGDSQRDEHLRSADFLDVASYPEITFKGKRLERLGRDRLRVLGDLTLRGVTHEVPLKVVFAGRARDPWGHERAGFTAKASIDRRDFGVRWNQLLELGGVLVGDVVDVEIQVEAVRQDELRDNVAAAASAAQQPPEPERPSVRAAREERATDRSPRKGRPRQWCQGR